MNKQLTITEEALDRIPERDLLQFLRSHGIEVVLTASGATARPAVQPKDYAEEAA